MELLQDFSSYSITVGELAKQITLRNKEKFRPSAPQATLGDFFKCFPSLVDLDLLPFDSLSLRFCHMNSVGAGNIEVFTRKENVWLETFIDQGFAFGSRLTDRIPLFYEWPYLPGDIVLDLFAPDLLDFFKAKGIRLVKHQQGETFEILPTSALEIIIDSST
jgi:hypothetical protein